MNGAHALTASRAPEAAAPSILVVEMDASARAKYREAVAARGYEVVEAEDGRDGLTKALMHPPAMVITGLRLPFIDGYALTEILRRDPATAQVPILVVTDQDRAAMDRAYRTGADVVLNKPATREQILAETQRLIADTRAVRQSAAVARAKAGTQVAQSPAQRARLSKSFERFETKTPPAAPPQLRCPTCDKPLAYQQSYVGGVNAQHNEQWDDFLCVSACGTFQYRHRTRKLRRV